MSHFYSGFTGLNIDASEFDHYVMKPDEVFKLFEAGARYNAQFVYPFLPADGFERPVIFSGTKTEENAFTLEAKIIMNKSARSCAVWFADNFLLPYKLTVKDRIQFFEDPEKGFGSGSLKINTITVERPNGSTACFAKKLLGVQDRPALFLKIAKSRTADAAETENYWPDAAIFFPAQAQGFLHDAVKFGEAFILIREGNSVSDEMLYDIRSTFNYLVKRSYGDNVGLYSIETHQSLDEPTPSRSLSSY